MNKEKRKNYKHEELMAYLNLSPNDLPAEIQEQIAEFERIDAKIIGYQPELEPSAAIIAESIQEWYDEEEEVLPFDDNERACYVIFYLENMSVMTPQEFRKFGGKANLHPKKGYKIGDKYELKPTGKGHEIVSLQEQE